MHLLLCFAHLHKRLATRVGLLKFLRSPQARQLWNFGKPRASRSLLMPRLSWSTLVSPGGTRCENPGLAGPHPHGGARSDALSPGFLSALEGMTRQGSRPSGPCLSPAPHVLALVPSAGESALMFNPSCSFPGAQQGNKIPPKLSNC